MKLKSIKGLFPSRAQLKELILIEFSLPAFKSDISWLDRATEAINQIGEKDLPKMDRKRLLEIMAQAYCVIPNKHKVMDSNLVIAMCDTLIANQDELFECK